MISTAAWLLISVYTGEGNTQIISKDFATMQECRVVQKLMVSHIDVLTSTLNVEHKKQYSSCIEYTVPQSNTGGQKSK